MIRRIIQFGTKFNDILNFPQDRFADDWEDNWSDEVQLSSLELQFADGSFRNLGFDQSRKITKQISKRFSINLFDKNISTRYHDHVHRVLRGGVKKLIAEREDGTLMWTYAEAKNIAYTKNGNGELRQQSYTVDFEAHIPYWFSFRDGQVGFLNVNSLEYYFTICSNQLLGNQFEYVTTRTISDSNCRDCLELIIEDDMYGGAFACSQQACDTDNTILKQFGVLQKPNSISICAESSAGFGIDVAFFNEWTNPTVIVGSQTLSTVGSIIDGEYIHLSTMNYNGTSNSMYLGGVTGGINSLSGEITQGNHTVSFSGNGTNGLVTFNLIKKYHN